MVLPNGFQMPHNNIIKSTPEAQGLCSEPVRCTLFYFKIGSLTATLQLTESKKFVMSFLVVACLLLSEVKIDGSTIQVKLQGDNIKISSKLCS